MNHDLLIDSVARELTECDAPVELRARVLAQLDAAPKRRWWPVLVPIAATAGLAAAVVLGLRPGAVLPATVDSPTTSGSSGVVARAPETSPAADPTTAPRTGRSLPVRVHQMSADERAWHDRALPPLSVAELPTIEPIQPLRPTITPINVEPLVSEPIALPALDARAGARQP